MSVRLWQKGAWMRFVAAAALAALEERL